MMMMIDFYEKPTAGKERSGYYDGFEIERPLWVWNLYRELENTGFRFHIVVDNQVSLIAMFNGFNFYMEQHPNDQVLGKRVDNFFQKVKLNHGAGTTVVVEEIKNEDSISEGEQLPQLQDDQLDTPSDGTVSDRRIEFGDRQSEHGGQDDTVGCDILDTILISPEVGRA